MLNFVVFSYLTFVLASAQGGDGENDANSSLTSDPELNDSERIEFNFDNWKLIGDLYISKSSKAGVKEKRRTWPEGKIYFKIHEEQFQNSPHHNGKTYLENIYAAMNEIENYTCIQFVEAQSINKDYVEIGDFPGNGGCSVHLGYYKNHGKMPMNLVNGKYICPYSTIVHEFLHSIGISHEHNRPDRDDFITVNWQNLQSGENVKAQFMKDGEPGSLLPDPETYGTIYNYGSIMHYNNKFMAQPGKTSMLSKNNTAGIGDSSAFGVAKHMTREDQKLVNAIYECQGTYPEAPETTNSNTRSICKRKSKKK